MVEAATDIGGLIAEIARVYVGVPSARHGKFHSGVYLAEEQEPRLVIDQKAEEHLRAWHTGSNLDSLDGYLSHKYEVHLSHSIETGLDCSALLNLVTQEAIERLGIEANAPRHVKGFYIWAFADFVPTNSLSCGDFIFFQRSTHRAPPDHMGIYAGNNALIHSNGGEGGKVEKVSLESIGSPVAAKRLRI